MSAIYELWDRETANQIGSYESRAEAMAIVRDAVRVNGADALATVALGRETEDGDTVVIAAGRDLADLALQEEPLSTSTAIAR
ncbi:MAG: hypothetical protein ACRDJH_01170 [Thermomicrobiales bacterium]